MSIGCSAQDAVDRLAQEPVVRAAVWNRNGTGGIDERLASQPTQSRLVLVVVDQPDRITGQLSLIPHSFFLVTNWGQKARSAERLFEHYRRRGTFEDRLGEFNSAIGVHLSQRNFAENEATMLLTMMAFDLTNICRSELEDAVGGCWDLKRFQLKLMKKAAQVVKHSRRMVMRVAVSAAPLWSQGIARMEG